MFDCINRFRGLCHVFKNSALAIVMLLFLGIFDPIDTNAQVYINEVLVNPQTSTSSSQFQSLKMCSQPTYGHEYIELYNSNPCDSFDISCFLIGFNNGTGQLNGTFRFPLGTKIAPGGFLSIGGPNSGATINLTTFCSNVHLSTGNDRWYLPNGDGYLMLWNSSGVAVDAVYWTFNAGEANKWGTDSDIQSAPSFIAAGTSCPAVSSLSGPSGIPSSSPIVHYAGVSPSIGTVIHRTVDGGTSWATNASPSLNSCNAACVPSNAVNITSITTVNALCGASNGSVSANISGGVLPINYLWSNGATTSSLSGLSSGNYSLTVTDALGCSDVASVTVNATSGTLTLSAVTQASTCSGSNGSVDLTVSGSSGPFTYVWSNGSTTQDILGISSGDFLVTVTDITNGCITTDTFSVGITGAALNLASVSLPNTTCSASGPCPVSDSVLINEVMHKPGPNTTTNQGLRRKEYVEIYNAGCRSVDISCWVIGSANMGIQTVSNPAYTGGFQFPAGTIIAPGQHIVVGGTESQDNTSYDSTFIDFDVSDFVGSNTCDPNTNWLLPNGDGWVGLYNSQGNAVDAVYWSFFSGLNINTDDDFASNPCVPTACSGISVLPSARQIFNSNPALISYVGISTNNDLTFSRVPDGAAWQRNIVPSISNGGNGNCNAACVTPPTPSGSCNGTASVNPSAGTAPYSYLWSTGQTLQTITGLCAGSYSVTVTDANGCSENASVTVTQTDAYQLNATVVQPSCGNNNGCISFDPTPTGTYFYNWPFPTVMNVDSVCGLAPGSYDITITSIDGCSIDTTIILTNSASVTTLTAAITNVSCNSGTNGAMAVTTSGGTAPYTYLWSNGLTTEDITGIGVGTYSLTATDVNGCTGSVSGLNVTQPIAITATVDVTDASCAGNDGAVAITVSGGTGGYNYIWSNGQTLSSIIGLNAGIYTLSITDANNCQLVLSDTVFGTTAITVTGSVINESCADSGSGAVDISFSGGTAPYSFIWSNASTTEDLSEISAGSYSLTLTDDAGCNAFYSATVTAPLLPVLNAQILPTGSQDSTINWGSNAILSGGSDQSALNVTYSWAYTGPGNPLFADQDSIMTAVTPEVDGAYVFIITALSADGCNVSDTLRLNVTEINPAIPTAFSPNKDGNNDLFEVVRLNKSMIKEFKVFNRWGQLLYDDSVLSSWDGKFNGAEQPRDVYIYLISWESPTGNVVKRGQITLMR